MPPRIDLYGEKFGRLTVCSKAKSKRTKTFWNCYCSCGTRKIVGTAELRNSDAKSCGCLQRETIGNIRRKHGLSNKHHLYVTWKNMFRRCQNKNTKDYKYYGERGIRVCKRWKNFALFLIDMGERPKGKTLDRKNTNGNYTPKNFRWATIQEQSQNRRYVKAAHMLRGEHRVR